MPFQMFVSGKRLSTVRAKHHLELMGVKEVGTKRASNGQRSWQRKRTERSTSYVLVTVLGYVMDMAYVKRGEWL
jgi:hypothetical protein